MQALHTFCFKVHEFNSNAIIENIIFYVSDVVAELMVSWTRSLDRPASGSLVSLVTEAGITTTKVTAWANS